MTPAGISETFSTAAPVSLYGATKLASETLALEYADAFGFPCFINRCGVLAGAGQFGRADQGIFAYWIHSWARRRPLTYLLEAQMKHGGPAGDRIFNVGGGVSSARSLRQLSAWCAARFGPHEVASETSTRPFDLPWMVLDASRAARAWGWRPRRAVEGILEDIAIHAEAAPAWLDLSGPL
jgi:CDP-paratose 2-epimerase